MQPITNRSARLGPEVDHMTIAHLLAHTLSDEISDAEHAFPDLRVGLFLGVVEKFIETYLARICFTQKLYGSVRNFHASLAKKAVLTGPIFRKPKPPNFFGLQILSQATSGKPSYVLEFFQKKFRLIWSNL